MKTKVENEGRTFPVSDSARSVYHVLVKEMDRLGVTVLTEVKVVDFGIEDSSDTHYKTHITHVSVEIAGKPLLLQAKKYILATGGTSHPETGSTGDAYPWLEHMGHTVIVPKPVLVPVMIQDRWVKDLQGVSCSGIKLTVYADGEKVATKKGRILCTHFGITGPTVLNTSKKIRDLLDAKKKVTIQLDLLPEYDHGSLNKKLQEVFLKNKSKMIKNTLGEVIPQALVETTLSLAKISNSIVCSQVTREERMVLIDTMKKMTMSVSGLLGEDKAIIASGGVPLTEIDFKTCSSRICDNVSPIGDLLDIDRPSGGYSLQLCWTTGYVAGKN
jgi:predicted Rossmann fold flavoprotein